MPNISQNLDKCLFSKRDVSLFIDNEKAGDASQKSEIIHELAPKHKATVVEFSSSQSVEFDQILKKLYLEAEKLIGYSVEKSLTRFSNEKKVFVLIELLKDCVLVFHDIKSIDQKTMVELQRMSLTLKRYTRARLRIIFVCLEDDFDRCIDAGLRMEYIKFYFTDISESVIEELQHAIDVEIKLERRGVDRFLGEYIESVKLRPRVKSFIGNI